MILTEFPDYKYENGQIIHISSNSVIKVNAGGGVCLKSPEGKWKERGFKGIQAKAGEAIKLTPDFKVIPFTQDKYFLNPKGTIYSFDTRFPLGKKLSVFISSRGYPSVRLKYKGKASNVELHQLLCVTFILEDYIEKGLVCLHKDDNKLNHCLSNISIGTYSKNNKDAYATGVNTGNGLKKRLG